jgi:hypothetical protein
MHRVHIPEKELNTLKAGQGRSRSYQGSISVTDIKVRFICGLETEDPVTENFLAQLDNIQPPVGGVVPRNTCESGIEGYQDEEQKNQDLPRNQSTFTRVLMLDIIYRISGVNTKGGVCVYENDQDGEKRAIVATVPGCRYYSCLSRECYHLEGIEPKWRFPGSYHQHGQ